MIHKLRAWDKTTNQMRACYGFNTMEQEVYVCSVADDEFNGQLETVHTLRRSFDEVVVMLGTGCRDKNGIEIYEGDVVKVGTLDGEPMGYIEWKANMACYRVTNHINPFGGEVVSEYHTKDFEVIGNIYEHPELLEVGE